jgi:hypothetical protein
VVRQSNGANLPARIKITSFPVLFHHPHHLSSPPCHQLIFFSPSPNLQQQWMDEEVNGVAADGYVIGFGKFFFETVRCARISLRESRIWITGAGHRW